MDTVRVEGVTYTKVAAIAKKFRYTTDYVGQLCRAGKVDCQFVGRAWYVSEESLLKHKDGRYVESRLADKTINNNTTNDISPEKISVSPRLKNVTAKKILSPSAHFLTRLEVGNSKYYADEAELLPQPLKIATTETAPRMRIVPTVPTMVAVEPAEAVSVRVTATSKPKKLSFTDVPAVALHGQLPVHEFEIKEDSEYVTPDQLAHLYSDQEVQKLADSNTSAPVGQEVTRQGTEVRHKLNTTVANIPDHSFTPQTVAIIHTSSRLWFLVSVAVLASSIFAAFFVSASQVFIIVGNDVSASIIFSLEGIFELF